MPGKKIEIGCLRLSIFGWALGFFAILFYFYWDPLPLEDEFKVVFYGCLLTMFGAGGWIVHLISAILAGVHWIKKDESGKVCLLSLLLSTLYIVGLIILVLSIFLA